jgi:hypothetical protein
MLIHQARMFRQRVNEEISNNGEKDELGQSEGEDRSEGESRDRAGESHPLESSSENEKTERDRGISEERCRVEEYGEGWIAVWCGGVEG